jgi:hypothetical protein
LVVRRHGLERVGVVRLPEHLHHGGGAVALAGAALCVLQKNMSLSRSQFSAIFANF